MESKREGEQMENKVENDLTNTEAPMSKTTTISTIAVQSGKTRIVIALLHVRNKVIKRKCIFYLGKLRLLYR